MDATIPGESGYTTEGPLASPWLSPSQYFGLTELLRGYNPTTGDHALMTPDSPLAGFSAEHLGAYGYERYGNAPELLLPLSAGGVTVASNQVAGGALWSWTYAGHEYIDHSDYGREIQTALLPYANNTACGDGTPQSNPQSNPTEAGDGYSGLTIPDAGRKHGAPTITFYNDSSKTVSPTQVTWSTPLEWSPDQWGGGPDNPVARVQMAIGKYLTLDFNGMGPVARYVTGIYSPVAFGAAWETTGYLQPQFHIFREYDAASQTEHVVTPPTGDMVGTLYDLTGAGGVIVADGSGDNAMGVYARTRYPASGFRVTDFTTNPSPTTKWQVWRNSNIPSGYSFWTQYIITGTVAGVEAHMRDLYSGGY
jgi:hypothetical protein